MEGGAQAQNAGSALGEGGRDTSPTNGWGGSDGTNDPRGLEGQPERGGHVGRGGWKVTAPGTGVESKQSGHGRS